MQCPECGLSSYTLVDGIEMSEKQLLNLKYAPKQIRRFQPHELWCTKRRELNLDK
jgi:hypothetical protein